VRDLCDMLVIMVGTHRHDASSDRANSSHKSDTGISFNTGCPLFNWNVLGTYGELYLRLYFNRPPLFFHYTPLFFLSQLPGVSSINHTQQLLLLSSRTAIESRICLNIPSTIVATASIRRILIIIPPGTTVPLRMICLHS